MSRKAYVTIMKSLTTWICLEIIRLNYHVFKVQLIVIDKLLIILNYYVLKDLILLRLHFRFCRLIDEFDRLILSAEFILHISLHFEVLEPVVECVGTFS